MSAPQRAASGGRYSPPGVPVVNFASEAGLAVLVALRYLPSDPADVPEDHVLGWTEIDAVPERVPDADEEVIRAVVTRWLDERPCSTVPAPSSAVWPARVRRHSRISCRASRRAAGSTGRWAGA